MVLRLVVVLIPQILMAVGVFLYIAKTEGRYDADLQIGQNAESSVSSFEGTEA